MRGRSRFFSSITQHNHPLRQARGRRSVRHKSTNRFESLERRALLAADIAVASFSANGTNLLVDYDISGANASAFNISIYRSSNGTSLDTLLQTQRMTASSDLQVGTGHRATFAPSFSDSDLDYFLVAVVDSSNEVSESSEANNQSAFAGGVFLASNGLLHVHGLSTGEYIVVNESTTFDVTFNGTVFSNSLSAVSGVRIRSHGGSDYVIANGTSKPQLICGGDGVDVLIAGGDNDILRGGAGDDSIYGYGGNDSALGEDGSDLLSGGDGNDTLTGGAGGDYLYGDAGHDILSGDAGNDSLVGGVGNDTFTFDVAIGALGGDTIFEGADADSDTIDLSSFTADLTVNLTSVSAQTVVSGVLTITIASYNSAIENVVGGSGNDSITGNARNNNLNGQAGADYITGNGGDDVLYGGAGEDLIYGNDGNDTIYGGDHADVIYSGTGNDIVYGEAGNDTVLEYNVFGDAGNDYFDGGEGNDSLWSGVGDDIVIGSEGNDLIFAGDGSDEAYGGAGADYLFGDGSNDLLEAGGGNDYLHGGAGNDTYRFWGDYDLGNDTIAEEAGNGTDTLDFSGTISSTVNLELLATGTVDQPVTAYLRLILSNANAIENVKGSAQSDYIVGNALANVIEGFGGNDYLYGDQGDDSLYGGDGNDLIYGQDNNDTIYGGSGNDRLYGNHGDCDCADDDSDAIYGETGDDWLYGEGDDDYLNGGSGTDTVSDGGQDGDFIADRPRITDFTVGVTSGGTQYEVSGHVEDDGDMEGQTVYLGGVLGGYTATVDENGDFSVLVPVEEIAPGEGTATVFDEEGLQSEVETEVI